LNKFKHILAQEVQDKIAGLMANGMPNAYDE